jgi:hypothetical protein
MSTLKSLRGSLNTKNALHNMPDVNTNQQFFNPLLFAMGSSGSSSAQLDKNRSLSAGLFFLPAELQM